MNFEDIRQNLLGTDMNKGLQVLREVSVVLLLLLTWLQQGKGFGSNGRTRKGCLRMS